MDEPFSLALWILIAFLGSVVAAEDEATLRERLLKDYDKSLPPIIYAGKYHDTYIGLNVLRIRGLDESKGEFIVEGPVVFIWSDERLAAANAEKVRFSPDAIWIPHLNVLNRVEEDELTVNTLPIVFQGLVWWIPRYVLRTSCIPNLKYYPFDKQKCEILIVSITDEGDLLQTNYSAPDITVNTYATSLYAFNNTHWKLISVVSTTKTVIVDIDSTNVVGVFTFELERTMPIIALAILTPSVLSMILLLTTFWMTAGSTIRTSLCATSILVSASSLFTIARILPVTGSNTPIIVEYVATSLILSTLSALQSVTNSVVSRCRIQPPISYGMIVEKFPKWSLVLLVLTPQVNVEALDEAFLFSENDERKVQHNPRKENAFERLWDKHIVLWDRLMFYLMGTIIFLLLISIIWTE